ncbi:transcription termination factor MTERF8, chloroplastic-like isoform X2 [Euphorbia lathyris]|uniref:transcription termination factor MTERF8, chloroplastic-like isoform X2 n=1 Tax=Euphorbia lathyris TaxID=212925 RepID=UPI00331429CB
MANHFFKNIFPCIRLRFLHSSSTLSSVSPSSTTAISSSSFTVEFLVNSCGLSLKSALSVSNKFQLNHKTPQKPQSVIQFLKSHHFSDIHVAQLIVKRPQVLNSRIHNNLKPKFDYLVKIGFEGELLPHIILSNIDITRVSLASQIKQSVQCLRLFLDSDEKLLMAVKRAPWLLSQNMKILLKQNVDVLVKEGVPAHAVEWLLISHPRSILQNPEKIIDAVNSVKALGFETTDTMFIQAFRVMLQMSESTWKKKIEVMNSMGFSEDEILKAFKKCPQCLAYSEENFRKTLDFYFNTMKLEPQTIIVHPALLGYSIEKRVRPRYHVLKVLESKKLIKGIKKPKQIAIGEKNFRDKYIDQFIDEVPGLLEFYLGMKEGKSSVLDGEEILSIDRSYDCHHR